MQSGCLGNITDVSQDSSVVLREYDWCIAQEHQDLYNLDKPKREVTKSKSQGEFKPYCKWSSSEICYFQGINQIKSSQQREFTIRLPAD